MQPAVLGSALAICIAACTSLSAREQTLELDDVWTANALPCDAEKVDVPVNVRKRSGQLTATTLASARCFEAGRVLWRVKLPAKPIVAADLPVALPAELMLQDASMAGMLTLLSETRMILTAEHTVVEVTRGAELPGLAGGAGAGGAGEPAEPGGTGGDHATQQPPAPAAGSEAGAGAHAMPPAGAADSGSAGRAEATPSSAAPGSGLAGSATVPAAGAGAGMPAAQAGAGMVAPPAAGNAGAAGGGVTGMFPRGWDLEDLKTTYWYCVSLEGGCVCINNNKNGYDDDNCFLRPRGCCYVLLEIDEVNCQCHAPTSARCMSEAQGPNVLKVDNCPPP